MSCLGDCGKVTSATELNDTLCQKLEGLSRDKLKEVAPEQALQLLKRLIRQPASKPSAIQPFKFNDYTGRQSLPY